MYGRVPRYFWYLSPSVLVLLGNLNPQLRGRETADTAESNDYLVVLTLSIAGDVLCSCLGKCYLSFLQVLCKTHTRDWLFLKWTAWLRFLQVWESVNEMEMKNPQQ